jgi:hypothetical protein
MKFKARVYRVNKNLKYQSYFATIKQDEFKCLELKDGSAILLRVNSDIFPTVIRKLHTTKERFMYGFSIPQESGKELKVKSDIDFEFLSTNLNHKIKENKKSLCLPNILPQKTIRNNDFYTFDLGENILVWIYSTGNKWCILPKRVPLSKKGCDLLELFGGYLCEALKARKIRNHLDRLSYSSSEIDQIEWFVSSMENLFNIKKSEWSAQILLRNYDMKNRERIVQYWANAGLGKDKIKIINNNLVNDKLGVCLVNIYNSSLAEAIYEVFQHCKQMALENHDNSLKFFRGLSRGDMGVSITHKKNLITFTARNQEDILFFKKICDNLSIKCGKIIKDKRGKNGCYKVAIHDFNSFQTIINLNAISHQRRKFNFYSKFLSCKGCTQFKYLKAVSYSFNTNKKVAEHLHISIFTATITLSKYRRLGLLNKTIRNFGTKHVIYNSLSEKGQEVLNFYTAIESEINK